MLIYVSSAFHDHPRARAFMNALRAMGHTISYDWTRDADAYPNNDAPPAVQEEQARADLRGVRAADLCVALNSPARTVGKWIEFGAALALERLTISVGPAEGSGAYFARLADLRVDTDAEALEAIRVRGLPGLGALRRGHIAGPALTLNNITINVSGSDASPERIGDAVRDVLYGAAVSAAAQ